MYLPFLRGKLYELKAIKEYIEDWYGKESIRHIMPIIEPVKKDRRPLMSCIEAMGNAGMPFAVVLNSRTGDYEKALFDVPSFLDEDKLQGVLWTPAFEVNGNANVDAVETVINENGLKDVMLIFFTIVDLDDEKIKRIVNNGAVKYIAALNMIQRPAILDELTDAGKLVITIEDCFQEKSPNNAYRDNLDESFSDTFQNVKTFSYDLDSSDYRNFAYIAGEGEGSDRTVTSVDIRESATEERRELYVDARDLQQTTTSRTYTDAEYESLLQQRGRQKLAEYNQRQKVESDVDPDANLVYGVDFDLGDICTVMKSSIGIAVDTRITEIRETIEGASRTVDVIFGEDSPTNIRKIIRRETT